MDRRLSIAVVVSMLLHAAAAYAMVHWLSGGRGPIRKEPGRLLIHKEKVPFHPVERHDPRPQPRPEPPRPESPQQPADVLPPRARPLTTPRPDVVRHHLPIPRKVISRPPPVAPHPSEQPKVVDLTARPVGGLSPDSFGGSGPAMPVGNTTLADPNAPRPRVIPRHAWSAPVPAARGPASPGVPVAPRARPRPRPRPRPVTVKMLPRPVSVPRLPYPEAARRQGIEGTVKLEVTIGKDGRVLKVRVIRGVGFGLDEVAVAALKRARFKPAVGSDGKPMVYTIRYRYTFRLER